MRTHHSIAAARQHMANASDWLVRKQSGVSMALGGDVSIIFQGASMRRLPITATSAMRREPLECYARSRSSPHAGMGESRPMVVLYCVNDHVVSATSSAVKYRVPCRIVLGPAGLHETDQLCHNCCLAFLSASMTGLPLPPSPAVKPTFI
jgi:hypothetical protein